MRYFKSFPLPQAPRFYSNFSCPTSALHYQSRRIVWGRRDFAIFFEFLCACKIEFRHSTTSPSLCGESIKELIDNGLLSNCKVCEDYCCKAFKCACPMRNNKSFTLHFRLTINCNLYFSVEKNMGKTF